MAKMTNTEFREIREEAGFDRGGLADTLLLSPHKGKQTIAQIEQGRSEPSGPMRVVMRMIQAGYADEIIAASEREE